MDKKKKLLFVVNPISGTKGKDSILRQISLHLNKSLFNYHIEKTQYQGHASELTQKAVSDGYDIVVAIGGDGTVNEVARSLVHTSTALGIIPCGSGNGLARHLRIPMDPRGAIDILNQCDIHDFDYGIINDLPFFCTCGMGFDAFISMKFANAEKRGPTTYIENILKEGLKYKPETYIVEDETGTSRYEAFLISCANAAQYGNNAYIAPNASMSDGLMDVVIMEPFNVIEAPQISLQLFSRTLDKNSKIKTFRTKRLHIRRQSPGVIHYDGDPVMTGADVDVELINHGIRIIANPAAKDVDPEANHDTNPLLDVFSEFFNDVNSGLKDNIDDMRHDIVKANRKIQVINKSLLRKLTRK